MMDIRRIFARQPQIALAEVDAAVPLTTLETQDAAPALETLLDSWPLNAGPFFTSDGQAAVAFAALLQTPEFQLEDVA